MAEAPKKPEQGLYDKIMGSINDASVKVMDALGGKEASDLQIKSIHAKEEGHLLEQAKLGFEAEAKIPGHLIDLAKGEVSKLMGSDKHHSVTGGHTVTEHASAPAAVTANTQGKTSHER